MRLDGLTFCGAPPCTNDADLSLVPVPEGADVSLTIPSLYLDLHTTRSETQLCGECLINCGTVSRNATATAVPPASLAVRPRQPIR